MREITIRTLIPILVLISAPWSHARGVFELSVGFGFNRSNFSEDSFTWTRKWGTSIAYHFTQRSGLELSFQDVTTRNFIVGAEDTNFRDRILSASWVQALTDPQSPVQPFFKIGAGQLIRDITGSYANGAVPPREVDSLTVVLGAGAKFFLFQNFAIRTEFVSYLSGGSLRTWKDNIAFSVGASIFF